MSGCCIINGEYRTVTAVVLMEGTEQHSWPLYSDQTSDVQEVGRHKKLKRHLRRHGELGHVHAVPVLGIVVEVLHYLLHHGAVNVRQLHRTRRALLKGLAEHVL